MRVLTMKVDQFQANIRQLTNGRQSTIHVRSRATIKWNNSAQNDFFFVGHETTFNTSLRCSGANTPGIGTTAHQKTDGFNQHRFSGTSFTSQNCETSSENQIESINDSEVFYM
jgi:hypothetical protein